MVSLLGDGIIAGGGDWPSLGGSFFTGLG